MAAMIEPARIREAARTVDALSLIEQGFVAYSQGRVVVPPVAEMIFDDPPGEVHIKYGYIKGDDVYVVKIASGFAANPKLGLPTGNGLMLVFDRTGALECLLLDEGYLTNLRTAAAGRWRRNTGRPGASPGWAFSGRGFRGGCSSSTCARSGSSERPWSGGSARPSSRPIAGTWKAPGSGSGPPSTRRRWRLRPTSS
jgi:hypothetical protein